MKNLKFTFLVIASTLLFQGCGKTQYELRQEKIQQQNEKFKSKQLKTWIENGYKKEQAIPWINRQIPFEKIKPWLALGIWQVDVIISWEKSGFEIFGEKNATIWIKERFQSPQEAKVWKDFGLSPKESKKWFDLGIKNPEDIQNINYDELMTEVSRQKISIEEYKQWISFGLIQPDDIAYFKSKGYQVQSIKTQNAKEILNSMSYEDFMKFMNINDKRLINTYRYSWKYNTNFKKFRDIVHRYYAK